MFCPDRSGGRIKSGHVHKSLSFCWGAGETVPGESLPARTVPSEVLKK